MDNIKHCLEQLGYKYQDAEGSKLVIPGEDHSGNPYEVVLSILDGSHLIMVVDYLPVAVGNSLPGFDGILLERHETSPGVKFVVDQQVAKYLITGEVLLTSTSQDCQQVLWMLHSIEKLVSYRQGDLQRALKLSAS